MNKSKLPLFFGVSIAAVLILVFFIFAAFGLHRRPIFSLLNGVIMAYGMFQSIKFYKKEKGAVFKYDKGFVATFLTGLNATVIFTLFFVFYASVLEPNYIASMLGSWSVHYNTPEGLVVFAVFIMGITTSMVLTLAYMQLFKTSWNTKRNDTKANMSLS